MGSSRARIPATMESNESKQPNPSLRLATSLIISAITVGGLVKGVLNLQYNQAERRSRNILEWPELKATIKNGR